MENRKIANKNELFQLALNFGSFMEWFYNTSIPVQYTQ